MPVKKSLDQEAIFEYFKKYFEDKGFEFFWDKAMFRKDNENGFDAILLSISEYETEFLIEFHLGKRINVVEKFAANYLDYPLIFNNYSMTIVCSFARLEGEKFYRQVIRNEGDLEKSLFYLIRFLNKRGFRVLEQWSSLRNLNRVFNEDPYSMNMFYNHFHKAIRGCIINRFTGDERYELLKEVYFAILRKNALPEEKLDSFKRLSGFLDIYNPN